MIDLILQFVNKSIEYNTIHNTMRVFSAPLYRKADREALQQ